VTVTVFFDLLIDELIEPIKMKNTSNNINAEPRHDANMNLKNCFIFYLLKICQRYCFFLYLCNLFEKKIMVSETVFILLGSNIGKRESLINQAIDKISDTCGKVFGKSPVYESEPWGFKSEQWFLNQVVEIETKLAPDELMKRLLAIELELGRDRVTIHEGYVSRPIDLDILYFGNQIIDTEYVTAPHPRLHLRRFTLLPLCDLAPDFVHPKFCVTNTELLKNCKDNGVVNKSKNEI